MEKAVGIFYHFGGCSLSLQIGIILPPQLFVLPSPNMPHACPILLDSLERAWIPMPAACPCLACHGFGRCTAAFWNILEWWWSWQLHDTEHFAF